MPKLAEVVVELQVPVGVSFCRGSIPRALPPASFICLPSTYLDPMLATFSRRKYLKDFLAKLGLVSFSRVSRAKAGLAVLLVPGSLICLVF